jgi:soluble lytic murein transglycosylase-like protein
VRKSAARRAAAGVLVVAVFAPVAPAQLRVERDRNGQIVITNKGSQAAAKLAAPESSQPIPRLTSAQRQSIQGKLKAACSRTGLDYNLVAALVEAESGFQPRIISKKGAIGLMQLLPETGRRFGCTDPWDMDENIEGGTNFLAYLHTLFSGDIPLMLAAYNAGENAVQKYSNKIPPYGETVRYVFNILGNYGRPKLVEEAKAKLASPSDYNKYYVPQKNHKPVFRTYYMYFEKGVRTIVDYPPSGVDFVPIVYKDE